MIEDKEMSDDKSDHIFLMFGCDYAFKNAQINYLSIDKTIEFWNDLDYLNGYNISM
jgi:hypothetical protein